MYRFPCPRARPDTGEPNRYLSTLDLWLVLMTAAVALASLGACPPAGTSTFFIWSRRGAVRCGSAVFSWLSDASVLHHRQLYAQSDRAKVDAAIAEKGIPAGERYILVGMQDGGRAYYIFQYLLDPAFLSLNLEDWRQADAILIYDPKPLELVYIEQTIRHPAKHPSSTTAR